jgi:hypothetical protein
MDIKIICSYCRITNDLNDSYCKDFGKKIEYEKEKRKREKELMKTMTELEKISLVTQLHINYC